MVRRLHAIHFTDFTECDECWAGRIDVMVAMKYEQSQLTQLSDGYDHYRGEAISKGRKFFTPCANACSIPYSLDRHAQM